MASELEEVLALLDAPPVASNELSPTHLLPPIEDQGLELHWGFLDNDTSIADFDTFANCGTTNLENATATATVQHETKKNKKNKNKTMKRNPNKVRDECRLQLIELNEQVAELQFTLNQLQTFQNKRPNPRRDYPSPNLEVSDLPPVWQEICTRQLVRRLKAGRENLRLKQQVHKEKQLVKSLQKLLYSRRALKDAEAGAGARKHTRRTDIPAGYIERMTALIFKELAVGVKVCYRKVDSFFDSNRLVPMDAVTHSALLDGDGQLKYTERKFFDRRTIPFDLRSTSDAWWENWQNYRGQGVRDTTKDEIIEHFGLEMSDVTTNTSATAYAQQITQRHVEKGRVLFVFDAYVEPFGFENERVSGVYILEQTYVLVQPEVTASAGGNDGFSTRISTYYVLTPHFLDPKLKEDGKTGAVIDFWVSALSSKVMALSETVEHMLLDQALQHPETA